MSKAIFVGGVGRSGTTLTKQLINRHRDIACFGETQLIIDPVFRNFPFWMYTCPNGHRRHLLDVYKQLCRTRFYRRRVMWCVDRKVSRLLHASERLWLSRFKAPDSPFWNNPISAGLERVWLAGPIQARTFGARIPASHEAQLRFGLRGLSFFGSESDITRHFGLLDALKHSTTVEDAFRTYGVFWSAVFTTYAQRRRKQHWAEKTPQNALHADILGRYFDNLRLIHIVRDGRDVACSNVQQSWGQRGLEQALDKWASDLTRSLQAQAMLSPDCYINIRYEDLVLHTESTLRQITDFLELDFDSAMLSQAIYQDSVGRYQEIGEPTLQAYAVERYGPLLEKWDYRTH